MQRIMAYNDPAVWTDLFPAGEVLAQADRIEARRRQGTAQPLYGLTFAVKDNIDYAGRPTAAGCLAFAYIPRQSAVCVQRLCDAGAICLGKTTLDQFATGLVGTRGPNGTPRNLFNPAYIPGGSSSGSAVAVAAGLVDFSLGTDTAGSGRVPAAFNNIVGFKPTRGLIRTAGLVPACRSLDTISIFAASSDVALEIVRIASSFDALDPQSRGSDQFDALPAVNPASFRFGVPAEKHLNFFGNALAANLYRRAIARLTELGGTRIEIDYSPFAASGRLLYDGPWVAERLEAAGHLLAQNPGALLPVLRQILGKAQRYSAAEAFTALHELHRLRRLAEREMAKIDLLALPTTGTIYTLDQIAADPLALNANLGYYTHFANLLDLCAVSVPSGLGADGLPAGLMLVGAAGRDEAIAAIGSRFHRSLGLSIGATDGPLPPPREVLAGPAAPAQNRVQLAVVGAHLAGQPLNHQLLNRAARLVRSCKSAPQYRFYALAGTVPPKPGLVRIAPGEAGAGVELEIWEMSESAFGSFVAAVPPPMVIGTLELEDGSWVKGFLCEPYALAGSRDISSTGGWRAYLRAASSH
jgi:allophanate hydrolase